MRDEQSLYANILDRGVRFIWIIISLTLAVYLAGIMPQVPLENLPRYWNLPAREYAAQSFRIFNANGFWNADALSWMGMASLPLLTLVCFVRILPSVWRKRERAYRALVGLQIAVLLFAAIQILR